MSMLMLRTNLSAKAQLHTIIVYYLILSYLTSDLYATKFMLAYLHILSIKSVSYIIPIILTPNSILLSISNLELVELFKCIIYFRDVCL